MNDESAKFRRRKEADTKYLTARDGDWLFAPFQCENCWFFNICKTQPKSYRSEDTKLLKLIRRVNLDIFWSRESSTIKGNLSRVKETMRRWEHRGGFIPLSDFKAWRSTDKMGMGIAITMLEKSLEPGRLSKYTQFDTCRQLRGTASNLYMSTAAANEGRTTYKSTGGNVFHTQDDPMQTILMERFVKGMKIRMPVESSRNLPLLGPVVKRILDEIEFEWSLPHTIEDRKRVLVMTAGYIAVTYAYSLRGNEGFWVDGDSLVRNINLGKDDIVKPHVVVALLGFFKAEGGERMHVFSISNLTSSGVRVRIWLERVVAVLLKENKRGGPAFCDPEGYILTSRHIEKVMHPILSSLQGGPGLEQYLPNGIDIETFYRCERSFRRGAETTALVNKVSKTTIELVHRWRNYEQSKGHTPGFNMIHHYADGEHTRPLQLEFSSAV